MPEESKTAGANDTIVLPPIINNKFRGKFDDEADDAVLHEDPNHDTVDHDLRARVDPGLQATNLNDTSTGLVV